MKVDLRYSTFNPADWTNTTGGVNTFYGHSANIYTLHQIAYDSCNGLDALATSGSGGVFSLQYNAGSSAGVTKPQPYRDFQVYLMVMSGEAYLTNQLDRAGESDLSGSEVGQRDVEEQPGHPYLILDPIVKYYIFIQL
ncbi:MAG: hypothetical protein KUG82_16170 [Pseudomonadales bacterium]|nr:hypothetical protein [Pseudomonadales bacterium]